MIKVIEGNSRLAGEVDERQDENLSAAVNKIATPYSCATFSITLTNATMISNAVMMAHTVE